MCYSSEDDGSHNSSPGYFEDEPSQGPASSAAQSMASTDKVFSHPGITPKIVPSYDGTTSWFEYEQLVDDWCDITTLDEEKRGPSLKTRLSGIATVQKEALDRKRLASKRGVEPFKKKMRPFLVKGEQYVFLWRFLGLFRAWNGNQGFVTWIAKFEIIP